jgi:hypothetical protein
MNHSSENINFVIHVRPESMYQALASLGAAFLGITHLELNYL